MRFSDRAQTSEKQNTEGAAAGYDLGSAVAQISYCLPGETKPETVSQVAGGEDYQIPACLARHTGRELWLYGKDAKEAAERGEAVLVDRLLERAALGEPVEVDGEAYDPVALLALFLRRSFSLLAPIISPDRLEALAFTVEEVTKPVLDALAGAVSVLGLKAEHVFVVGRAESFFYYNINQPEELMRRGVLICELEPHLKTLLFSVNRRTTPMAAFVEEKEREDIRPVLPTGDAVEDDRNYSILDHSFAAAMEEVLEDGQVSTVYLLGDGFAGEWYRETLQVICAGRRVFLGNNLYSKGACYAARQRLLKDGAAKGYAFLGKDMLKANVGMHVSRRGEDAYLALLDAGVNWYEAGKECEFLLEEENVFTLRITPLNGRDVREVRVTLSGLPQRPARTSRIRMKMEMADASTVHVSLEDLGFGEFFPATHRFWEEQFSL